MSAYYNDHDPSAAEWLRELIKAGVIPDGYVDERSILDVRADDLEEFTQCHFFAGIGGWPLALRLAGWPDDRPVWTGSPPCQPFSVAGEGKGSADERHLSPKFIGLVRDGRPEVLFGEQVASAAVFGKAAKSSRKRIAEAPEWAWLDDLSDRLEAARYAVGASDIPSAGVGAPHIRQRTFFGAYDLRLASSWVADDDGSERGSCIDRRSIADGQTRERDKSSDRSGKRGHAGGLGNRLGTGLERLGCRHHTPLGQRQGTVRPVAEASELGGVADCNSDGCDQARQRIPTTGGDGFVGDSALGGVADCNSRRPIQRRQDNAKTSGGATETGQEHGPALSRGDCTDVHPGPTNSFWRDADWLFCRDGKWRPVEPGTFPLAHGVSGRVGLLRGYGNAINPWAAKAFIEAFEEARTECFRLDRLSALTNDTTGVFG